MSNWVAVLTGGIASGKSLVASVFIELGIEIIEQDELSREVVEPHQTAFASIVQRFGTRVINGDGTLDRAALRQRIFNHRDDKKWLEQLLHPLINQLTIQRVLEAQSSYAIVVNPLLSSRAAGYDRHIVVDVSPEIQLARAMQRDGMTKELAEKMIEAQLPREVRLRLADDVIHNNGAKDEVVDKVNRLHRRYLTMAYR